MKPYQLLRLALLCSLALPAFSADYTHFKPTDEVTKGLEKPKSNSRIAGQSYHVIGSEYAVQQQMAMRDEFPTHGAQMNEHNVDEGEFLDTMNNFTQYQPEDFSDDVGLSFHY